MKEKHDVFNQILGDARKIFKNARPGPNCPALDILAEYSCRSLTEKKAEQISAHIAECETCQIVVMRLEADQYFWNNMLELDEESVLVQALGKKGLKVVNGLIRKASAKHSVPITQKFVSKIQAAMVAWTSPLWQPMYAGEAVTAVDVEEQSTRFEMDYGEYINLSCHWQEEKDCQPYIDLSWQANLLQPSRIWARFIDPDSSTVFAEILLGKELEGKIRISSSELSFNPATNKWAIAIIVEE